MERIWTTELPLHISKPVLLKGWLHHFRQLSMVSFLLVRDAQGIAQVVVDDPALVEKLAHLKHESVLAIQGTVHLRPQAPNGVEIVDAAVDVLVASTEDPPVALYHPAPQAQLPTIMDSAPVTLRHPRLRAAFRLADAACRSRVKVDPGLRLKMDPPRQQRDHISVGGEPSTKS